MEFRMGVWNLESLFFLRFPTFAFWMPFWAKQSSSYPLVALVSVSSCHSGLRSFISVFLVHVSLSLVSLYKLVVSLSRLSCFSALCCAIKVRIIVIWLLCNTFLSLNIGIVLILSFLLFHCSFHVVSCHVDVMSYQVMSPYLHCQYTIVIIVIKPVVSLLEERSDRGAITLWLLR